MPPSPPSGFTRRPPHLSDPKIGGITRVLDFFSSSYPQINYLAQPLGIEPSPRGLEALVLPVHHSCIIIISKIFKVCQVYSFNLYTSNLSVKIYSNLPSIFTHRGLSVKIVRSFLKVGKDSMPSQIWEYRYQTVIYLLHNCNIIGILSPIFKHRPRYEGLGFV